MRSPRDRRRYAPDAVIIVVTNPLDEMTALAQRPPACRSTRVMGQAGMLDTARFSHFVAEELGVPVRSVRTLTLGSHGDTMVPVPSACTVDGKPLADLLAADSVEALVDRTRNGGAEVVALLKTGSAYYAPSAAAARMARAVAEDSGAVMPVCAWVDGEYGISGVYLGVEAEIGAGGVRRVVERDLTDSGAGRARRRPRRRSGPSRPTSPACRRSCAAGAASSRMPPRSVPAGARTSRAPSITFARRLVRDGSCHGVSERGHANVIGGARVSAAWRRPRAAWPGSSRSRGPAATPR